MIRKYFNVTIYRNLKVVKILSAIALILSIISIILYLVIKCTRFPNSEIGEEHIFACVMAILIPLNQLLFAVRGLKTATNTRKSINSTQLVERFATETKLNNDFVNTLTVVIISLLSLDIFDYIADGFLIHNCILIKREWKDNPPSFVKKNQNYKNKKDQNRINNQNSEQYEKLIEQCGVRFFIKYYKQIKQLPLRDVVISENYTANEKEERLLAAKKLIDLGLSEFTLNSILN